MIQRIIEIRKHYGLNQEQFAEKINLSRSFINQIEVGKRNVSDRTIADICREFHVNETWLRTGEGEMFSKVSRSEEIAGWIGNILTDDRADFKRRFVSVLARLTEEEWELIERRARELLEDQEKEEGGD